MLSEHVISWPLGIVQYLHVAYQVEILQKNPSNLKDLQIKHALRRADRRRHPREQQRLLDTRT